MEPIRLHFTPTVDDFARANRRLQIEAFKQRNTIVAGVLIVVAVIVIMITTIGDRISLAPRFLLFTAPPIALVLLVIWAAPWLKAQRMSSEIKAAGEVSYEFSDDSIVVRNLTAEMKESWAAYSAALVTNDYYFLMLAPGRTRGRLIPRRAFETPEQEAAFRELLKRTLNFAG